MSELRLRKLEGEEFDKLSGSDEDFAIVQKWAQYYEAHASSQPITDEEMKVIVHLLSKLLDGPEFLQYGMTQIKKDRVTLTKMLQSRGYKPWGLWTEET